MSIRKNVLTVFKSLVESRVGVMVLVGCGVLFRFRHYFQNLSMRLDEAWVGIDILIRSPAQILGNELWFKDIAVSPIGFSLFEKWAVEVLGNSEWAFRFFPFTFSIISIFLFYRFLKLLALDRPVMFIALALFAFSDQLIYYAADVKQYSGDVLATLLLYGCALTLRNNGIDKISAIGWGGMGGVLLWFSNPAVFVLAGLESIFIYREWRARKWKNLLWHGVSIGVWLVSFAALYCHYIKVVEEIEPLKKMWENAFMPMPFSPGSVLWMKTAWIGMMGDPLGFKPPEPAFIVFVVGAVAVFKTSKEKCLFLLAPVILAFAASLVHKYPFEGRLVQFYVPPALIVLSEGVVFVCRKAGSFRLIAALVLGALLFLYPLKTTLGHFAGGYQKEDNRTLFKLLYDGYRPGDTVFYNLNAQYAFLYYAAYFRSPYSGMSACKFSNQPVYDEEVQQERLSYSCGVFKFTAQSIFAGILGTNQSGRIHPAGNFPYKGSKRVWILFSAFQKKGKEVMLQSLDRSGKRMQEFRGDGVELYLYEMGVPKVTVTSGTPIYQIT